MNITSALLVLIAIVIVAGILMYYNESRVETIGEASPVVEVPQGYQSEESE
jgi:hypothetical protein